MRTHYVRPMLATAAIVVLGSTAGATTPNSLSCAAGSGNACFAVGTSAQNAIKAGTSAMTGVAIIGKQIAAGGSGAGVMGSSASDSILFPGVDGESTAPNGTYADTGGAFGLTALLPTNANNQNLGPTYGALAFGQLFGFVGTDVLSNGGVGVVGSGGSYDTGTEGLNTGSGGFGVVGSNAGTGIGVLGSASQGSAATGNVQTSNAGGYFLELANTTETSSNQPASNAGAGLVADSDSTAGLFVNRSLNNQNGVPATGPATSVPSGSGVTDVLAIEPQGYALYETDTSGDQNFSVDQQGNINATSLTTTNPNTATTALRSRNAAGVKLGGYSAYNAAPTVEDVGEAQLVNGRGVVEIESRFASVMSAQTRYHVFLTPEGDGNGLYVTQKSPTSFVVAEQHGGRSTMAFDYRIVADTYGSTASRLPLMAKRQRVPASMTVDLTSARNARVAHGKTPALLSPQQALLKKLGPAGYARALAVFKANLTK